MLRYSLITPRKLHVLKSSYSVSEEWNRYQHRLDGGIESLLLRHGEGRVLFWRIHVKRVVLRNQLAEDDSIKL